MSTNISCTVFLSDIPNEGDIDEHFLELYFENTFEDIHVMKAEYNEHYRTAKIVFSEENGKFVLFLDEDNNLVIYFIGIY